MIAIRRLLALDGPNLFSPQPGVSLQLVAAADCRPLLLLRLKDAAQRIGIILASLEVGLANARAQSSDTINITTNDGISGYLIEVYFVTPTPALGAAIVQYVVASLQAEEHNDTNWDADQQLFELQQLRRETALPITILQLVAEAYARNIPSFIRSDGLIQIGYGIRGVTLGAEGVATQRHVDPSAHPYASAQELPANAIGVRGLPVPAAALPQPDWALLGTIPLLGLSGPASICATTITALQHMVPQQHMMNTFMHAFWQSSAHISLDEPFDQVRTVLSDPALTALTCTPNMQSVAEHGLPFTSCDACIILGLPDVATIATERGQLAGLLVLVTRPTGVAVLNADVPDLAMLAAYASCHIIWFSQHEAQLAPYLAADGVGVFARGQQIWSAVGGELALRGELLPNLDVIAQLAAWALLYGLEVFPNGINAKT